MNHSTDASNVVMIQFNAIDKHRVNDRVCFSVILNVNSIIAIQESRDIGYYRIFVGGDISFLIDSPTYEKLFKYLHYLYQVTSLEQYDPC